MHNIYLPVDNINNYQCYVIQNGDVIRAYVTTPRNNSSSNYTDFYINSHYIQTNGTQTWGNTSSLPSCINSSIITNEIVYSNDFLGGLFIFCILFFFIIYFPYRIMRRILGRWLVI